MLGPDDRKIYLNEIKPPVGYELDFALGTTYSLNLLSLIMVPLSLAFFSAESPEEVLKSPQAILEALRRKSDDILLFCQQGQIKVPRKDTYLYNYLESIVYDVNPPSENGVFHPKIWVMKYVCEGEPAKYRVICLSRNLTFDNSWDIALTLEGNLRTDRTYAFSQNHPLGDFIAALPDLTAAEIGEDKKEKLIEISKEVRRVKFTTPPNFSEEVDFIPLGIKGYRGPFTFKDYDRLMMISPFLNLSLTGEFLQSGEENILISTSGTLDGFSGEELNNLRSNSSIYIIDEAAETMAAEEEGETEDKEEELEKDFSGLHAKLYIAESGWDAKLFTGSANASRAGFNGKNVEFLVGLEGRKSQIGIDEFLGDEEDKNSMYDLLTPYEVEEDEPVEEDKSAERAYEKLKQKLASLDLQIFINEAGEDLFDLIIYSERELVLTEENFEIDIFPITLKNSKKKIDPLLKEGEIRFEDVSLESLTSFVAFQAKILRDGSETKKGSFVFNLPAEDMPEKRNEFILQKIISNKEKFLEYLLFLLSDEEYKPGEAKRRAGTGQKFSRGYMDEFPLLEEMIKAYSKNPKKLGDIKNLIDDLSKTDEGADKIPHDFMRIWRAFEEARFQEDA